MTRHRTHLLFLACAALGLAVAPAAGEDRLRPTLAIVDFETTPAGTLLPPPQLGQTLAQLMLDELVKSGQYRVLDGRWLQTGTYRSTDRRPAGPADRGPVDRGAAFAALCASADAAGVEYLVLGSVTRFSAENRSRTVGGGAFILPLLAGVQRRGTELAVAITVRVVDVRSGEVMTTATSQGTAGRKQLALGGLSLATRGGVGGMSNSSSDFRDSLLDESIHRAVATAAQALVNAVSKLMPHP